MDDNLRESERNYQMGKISVAEYAAILLRAGQLEYVEQQAFLGNQSAVMPYLHMLSQRGDIDIDNLWICPFELSSMRSQGAYPLNPNATVEMLVKELEERSQPSPRPGTLAFIVDVADLELSDALAEQVGRATQTLTTNEENEINNVLQFHALCYTAIAQLRTTPVRDIRSGSEFARPGIRFVFEECAPIERRRRSTYAHHRPWFGTPPNPPYNFPRRRTKRKLIPMYPPRGSKELYVVVVHLPTGRAYGLNSSYSLVNREITSEEISDALLYSNNSGGWNATHSSQRPEWTEGLPDDEFMGFWVQE